MAHAGERDSCIYMGEGLFRYVLRDGNESLRKEILDEDEYQHLLGRDHGTIEDVRRRLGLVDNIKYMLLSEIGDRTESDIDPRSRAAAEIFRSLRGTVNSRKRAVREAIDVLRQYIPDGGIREREPVRLLNTVERVVEAERLLASLDLSGENSENVPEEVRKAGVTLRGNTARLEADSIIEGIAVLAKKAAMSGRELIVGLELDWLPKGTANSAREEVLREIKAFHGRLDERGMNNIVLVESDAGNLAADLSSRIDSIRRDDGKDIRMSDILVLASSDTIDSASFRAVFPEDETMAGRPFLAGVDMSSFADEDPEGQVKDIDIVKIFSLTLELAIGAGISVAEFPGMTLEYNEALRKIIFLPRPAAYDHEELKDRNQKTASFLRAA